MNINELKELIADDNLGLLKLETESEEDWIEKRISIAKQGYPVLQRAWDHYCTYIYYVSNSWYFVTYDVHFNYWRDPEKINEEIARFSLT